MATPHQIKLGSRDAILDPCRIAVGVRHSIWMPASFATRRHRAISSWISEASVDGGPPIASPGYGFGGKTWRVPQPVPVVSECLELIRAARDGDRHSVERARELYEDEQGRQVV